jgi:hypothetical protein
MTPGFARVLAHALRSGTYDRVVALEVAETSTFNPDWLRRWDEWNQNYVALMKTQSLYPLAAERKFSEAGVTVRIYVRGSGAAAAGSTVKM